MPPIDASIALGVRPLQVDSPINALSRSLQVQGLQRQNALGDMQLQQGQQDYADSNALRDAIRAGADPSTPEGMSALLRAAPLKAQAFLKSQADLKKSQADITKSEAETKKTNVDASTHALAAYRSMLPLVRSPQDFAQWVDGMYSNPATAAIAQQFGTPEQVKGRIPTDPAQFQAFLQQNAVGMEHFIQNQTTLRGQDMSATTAKRGQDITAATARRGQDLTDARAHETTRVTMTKPFEVTGPDGTPMLVQQDKEGNIRPVQGYGPKAGSAKPLTDAQAKALGYGSRMQESDKLISGLEEKGVLTPSLIKQAVESTPLIGGALGVVANATVASDNQQSVEQAQRDFLNAVLRRESGAVISDQEFTSGRKQYFPQPGDSKQVREQKARNRQLATRGVLAEVPEGQRSSLSKPSDGGASGGWTYLGTEGK